MNNKKKTPFLKRLFPHNALLRIIFAITMTISCYLVIQNAYHFVQVKRQEAVLLKEKEKLENEKARLEQTKDDLQDLGKLEKKARDELGLVKPGEVPYVK